MITTAQGTFGVLLVPKKCPALVNIKTVVSVRQVASGGGATDVGAGPNITGGFNSNNGVYDAWNNYFFADGAFSCNGFTDPDRRGNAGGSGGGGRITVSASRVSSAYGKSSTVQVASLRIMPCIKL